MGVGNVARLVACDGICAGNDADGFNVIIERFEYPRLGIIRHQQRRAGCLGICDRA
jgi:hypothetical protein